MGLSSTLSYIFSQIYTVPGVKIICNGYLEAHSIRELKNLVKLKLQTGIFIVANNAFECNLLEVYSLSDFKASLFSLITIQR
jgi:hypothetical protein